MGLITEKNLSKTIILTFIIIMSSMVLSMSYFYINNTYDDFEIQMGKFKEEYYSDKKKTLKKEINTVIDILNYNVAKSNLPDEELKTDAIRLLNNITFEENKSNYFFVYEIKNIEGGDEFAKLVVNPNRPDLVGTFISTNYEDADGKKFREDFLRDIRYTGESFTKYAYNKPNEEEAKQKLSYFKYYEKWNWVIAVGIYTDDIEKEMALKELELKKKIKNQVVQNVVLFLMFLSIAILISIFLSQKIDKVLKNYENKVLSNAKELEELNHSLEQKVKEEIDKNREKEQLLVQKSKFIALGEMISNIAHQWRQPLSIISTLATGIKLERELGISNDENENESLDMINQNTQYLSKTIDDFKNFFKKSNYTNTIYTDDLLARTLKLISSRLKDNNIEIILNNENVEIDTYENELIQIYINILNNSIDAFMEVNYNKYIFIETKKVNSHLIIEIKDNAGGIADDVIGKVFEPYFSTKDEKNGTGLGLYMCNEIVTKHLKGTISVQTVIFDYLEKNYTGASFKITLQL